MFPGNWQQIDGHDGIHPISTAVEMISEIILLQFFPKYGGGSFL